MSIRRRMTSAQMFHLDRLIRWRDEVRSKAGLVYHDRQKLITNYVARLR